MKLYIISQWIHNKDLELLVSQNKKMLTFYLSMSTIYGYQTTSIYITVFKVKWKLFCICLSRKYKLA